MPFPNLLQLFGEHFPVKAMTRQTRTPVVFMNRGDNLANFIPLPGKGIITMRQDLSPEQASTSARHEQVHAILSDLGTPKTTYSERIRPMIEAELESRGYNIRSRLDQLFNIDRTIDEGLAFAVTDPLGIATITPKTRARFVDESFAELERQGKDISILKKLRVP